MKNFRVITLHFILLLCLASIIAQADDKIRIVTEAAYPPFNMKNEKGEIAGFDVDVAKALCEKMKAECIFTAEDWDGIVAGLDANKYDAIVNSMSITESREKKFTFSNPYYSNKLAFVAKKEGDGKLTKNDLKGKRIGAQRETVSSRYLEGIVNIVKIKLFPTQDAVWQALIDGQIDAALSDKLLGYVWLKENAEKGFTFVGDPININDKIGIAFRKEDKELAEKFNQALAQILKDGTYERINGKYFPFSIY